MVLWNSSYLVLWGLVIAVGGCEKGKGVSATPGQEEATECASLPARRPADFEVQLWHRGAEPESVRQWRVAVGDCHFEEVLHWFDSGVRWCIPVEASTLEALYQRFREQRFTAIRDRELAQFSPHRGGFSLAVFLGTHRCEVSDSLMFEVESRWKPNFDALVDAVAEVIDEHQVGGYAVGRDGRRVAR